MGANSVFLVFMVLRQRLEMMRLQELQRIVSDPLKLMETLTKAYGAAQTQHPHEAN